MFEVSCCSPGEQSPLKEDQRATTSSAEDVARISTSGCIGDPKIQVRDPGKTEQIAPKWGTGATPPRVPVAVQCRKVGGGDYSGTPAW